MGIYGNDLAGTPLILGAAWKDGACVICSAEELQNCPEEKCTAELHEGAVWNCAGSCEDDHSGLAAFNEAYGGDYLQSCDQVPALAKSWDWPDLCTETPTCVRTCAVGCVICSVDEPHSCPEEECTAELHEGALLDIWDSWSVKSILPERE